MAKAIKRTHRQVHVDIATTEIYARADTEMKRKALEKAYPEMVAANLPYWEKDETLLTWLVSLQRLISPFNVQ